MLDIPLRTLSEPHEDDMTDIAEQLGPIDTGGIGSLRDVRGPFTVPETLESLLAIDNATREVSDKVSSITEMTGGRKVRRGVASSSGIVSSPH